MQWAPDRRNRSHRHPTAFTRCPCHKESRRSLSHCRWTCAFKRSRPAVSVHAGALLFALDLNPAEHTTGPGGCYYPPEGCEIAALKPSVNWRQGLLLDKSAGPSGGLTVERIQKGGAAGIAPPFNRASVALRIVAKATSIANTSWPTVNCTSMESGCHDCVGPIPSEAVVRESMLREGESEMVLLPFGATDIRMGVLPATWI